MNASALIRSGHLRPGVRVYAVGDIHGYADLLGRMATLVADDLAANRPDDALTVFVGDYIDRGPASAAVIDRLLRRDFPTPIVTLRGNHEQMLLDGLEDDDLLRNWISNGGLETAESYGIGPTARHEGRIDRFRHMLRDSIPDAHLAFLRATELSHSLDGYFFCHAGVEPGVPLEKQQSDMLLWIRKTFHDSVADHGKVVVHGHTPVRKPESLPNRINVDTHAFRTGRLTCAVLENGDRRFLTTRA